MKALLELAAYGLKSFPAWTRQDSDVRLAGFLDSMTSPYDFNPPELQFLVRYCSISVLL
jgi:hypothetical protein